jgi:O-antigen/teichoic acid export membrane protein
MSRLRRETASAAIWSFVGNTGSTIIRFGIGIVIARILSPEDYGLVAMLAIFIGIGDALIDSGFSQALIQKKEPTQVDYSSVFFLNILIALSLYFLLLISSPLIAAFYEEPSLRQLTIFLSLVLIINSTTSVQSTILAKELRFKEISKFRVVSTIISGFVAIPMALKGFGVWSLIGLSLSQGGSFSLLIWIQSKWRPSLVFSISSIKQLFGFGSRILAIGLLDNFFLHLHKLIIGKYFYANELGLYTRAYNYRDLVSKRMLSIVNAVSFPAFSRIQDNHVSLKLNYQRVSELAIYLITPSLALLAFTSEPLIRFLITEKWIASVPYLQILCIAGMFYPVSGLQVSIFKALGKVNTYLRIIFIHKIAIIISILIAIRWGVMGLVYAQVLTMLLVFLLGAIYIKKFLKIELIIQMITFFKYPLVGFMIFFSCYYFANLITSKDLLLILIQTLTGPAIYFLWGWIAKTEGSNQTVMLIREQVLPRLKKRKDV